MLALLLSIGVLGSVWADTPANCTYDDIEGVWDFYETARVGDNTIDCSKPGETTERTSIVLTYPNAAKDEFGNIGTWTLVYNQGFEVTVNGRSYFAFSDYKVLPDGETVESYCDRTQVGSGWSHDITIRNWACFHARKRENKVLKSGPKIHTMRNIANKAEKPYKHDMEAVKLINSMQNKWVAGVYPKFEDMTMGDIENLKGGANSRLYDRPSTKPTLKMLKSGQEKYVPESWDWRNVDGVNYVPKVRDQGKCGSCYAFASRGMLEARLNILTKNTRNISLSPQDIMDCSPLSQGCSGGFPYLVAGRYGKDYGFVEESCNPYRQEDGTCSIDGKKNCVRHYTARYAYVGGYYGACNEDEMKKALVKNGPMAVAFEVESDFMMYKSGIYHHTKVPSLLKSGVTDFDPFEMTNHAVLLVGYGYDSQLQEKFWIVQNSWGENWGESGYFRIRRGTDECAIESIAVEAFPIP
eukprot:TRINITY_DN12461_c0_g1_i3.p1 TRINITY_DN12461_c0_g1~~TRINITY_DN12461_c0_g1_i3.p1  ORF type:complete len:477 (-),score=87.30 TRINITY_DN12461_c0_g1_i3:116-1519(-)